MQLCILWGFHKKCLYDRWEQDVLDAKETLWKVLTWRCTKWVKASFSWKPFMSKYFRLWELQSEIIDDREALRIFLNEEVRSSLLSFTIPFSSPAFLFYYFCLRCVKLHVAPRQCEALIPCGSHMFKFSTSFVPAWYNIFVSLNLQSAQLSDKKWSPRSRKSNLS